MFKRLSPTPAKLTLPKTKLTITALLVSVAMAGCSPTQPSADDSASTESTSQSTSEAATDSTVATANNDSGTVAIDTVNGDVDLPVNPHPIAVYDMTLMQDLSALGVPVEGLPTNLHLDNLKAENTPDSIDIGTLFEPDMEALNAMQPKAILIGGRMASKYDTLKQMAPTLDMSIDTEHVYDSSKQRLADLGRLFNKEDKAAQLQQDIDNAIAEAKSASAGKGNALVILINGNKISAFGKASRFGFLHTVFDIPMADPNIQDATHGQPVSFEYLQKTNPDWLFVLDRASAIGEEGIGAKAVLDNPLVHETNAWKNDHIVYLSPDSYLAYGGYYQWLKDAKLVTDSFSSTANN